MRETRNRKVVPMRRLRSINFSKVLPNNTYTISWKNDNANINSGVLVVYYSSNNTSSYISTTSGYTTTRKTFTTPNNCNYVKFLWANANNGSTVLTTTDISNIQLEKGSTATTYEPYQGNTYLYQLDNTLRSIGDTKDLLYIKNGMLYVDRRIGSKILNGSESWIYYNNLFLLNVNATNFGLLVNNQLYSNYFIYSANNAVNGSIKTGNSYALQFRYDDITSANNFKTWLSTHNTEVQYVLATPYIEEVGQVQIPYAYVGVNNVNIYTGLNARSTIWYYWKNYDVLFAGVVKNSGDISLNPRHPHYCSLQILDYKTFLSESNTLDFVIANKTISEAINMVVNAVSGYGFICNNKI